jgi:hypothetical protein
MAWLESTGGMFRISFRFERRKHHLPLNTADPKEGDATLERFEANFRLIEQGVIDARPEWAEVA